MAELSEPDMKGPIQSALTYPGRIPRRCEPFDFAANHEITFEEPHMDRFPCLRLAYEALETGGSMPAVLNAANEIAVKSFLSGKIGFADISEIVEHALNKTEISKPDNIDSLIQADNNGRAEASKYIETIRG